MTTIQDIPTDLANAGLPTSFPTSFPKDKDYFTLTLPFETPQEDNEPIEEMDELDIDEGRMFGRGASEIIDMIRDLGHLVRRK